MKKNVKRRFDSVVAKKTNKTTTLRLESLESRELLSVAPGSELLGIAAAAFANQDCVTSQNDVEQRAIDLSDLELPTSNAVASTTWTVSSTADDASDSGTLRYALANAAEGDTIIFASSLKGQTIELDSSLGKLEISQSVAIDASNLWDAATSEPGLTISGGGTLGILSVTGGEVEVNGVTFTNASSGDEAIYVSGGKLSLANCYATGNSGYGIYGYGGEVELTSCNVTDNGKCGVYIPRGQVELTSCRVTGNSSYGLYVGGSAVLAATNCLVAGNHSNGIELFGRATFYNCTIAGNKSGVFLGNAVLTAYNTIIAGNTESSSGFDIHFSSTNAVANAYNTLSSYKDWTEGANYVVYDESKPLFTDAANGDYTLAENSQAINRGNNQNVDASTTVDLAGNPRVFYGTADLGAYEYQGEVVSAQLAAPENPRELAKTEETITVVWDAVDSALYYRVWYQPSGGAAATVDVDSTTTSYTLTDLTPNTTYAVKVAAIGDGVCYTDSDYSASTSMTMPDNPEARSTVVTTADDVYNVFDGVVSLREALDYANSGDTITFDGSLQGETIKLNSTLGQLAIDKSLTIDASALRNVATSEPGLTISGEGASRILYVDGASASLAVEINGIAFKNGYSVFEGGAIYNNRATLSLDNCSICDNKAWYGGGVYSRYGGASTFVDCYFANNYATEDGGGAYCYYGATIVVDCLMENNYARYRGGAIAFYGGTPTLTRCALTNNETGGYSTGSGLTVGYGGAIYNSYSTTSLNNCEIRGNSAYCGEGGGMFSSGGSTTLVDCLVAENYSNYCGGIYNSGSTLSLDNCEISGNKATYLGGGAYLYSGSTTLNNCTVTNNTVTISMSGYGKGGGVYLSRTAVFNANNTIIAGNTAKVNGDDVYLDGSDAAANAYNTLSGYADWTNASEEGVVNYSYDSTAPLFTDAANGDYTLAAGSQAIDKGDDQYVAATTTVDLAGNPRKVGASVDLGAYEYQILSGPVQIATPTVSVDAKATSIAVSWNVVSHAVGYGVSYKLANVSDWSDEIDAGTNLSYTIDGLEPNTEYSVRVRAIGDGGDYLDSEYATLTVTTLTALVVTSAEDVVDDSDDVLTLREALEVAQPGDTILFDSSLRGKTISLDSELGELAISQSAIIDASNLWNATTSEPGLTISGEWESSILYINGNDVEIKAITFTGSSLGDNDCAVYVRSGGEVSLTNCAVVGNEGRGIYVYNGDVSLASCVITGNGNGGVYVSDACVLTAKNTLIARNDADFGAGIELYGNATLYNCTVVGNTAYYEGGGVDLDGGAVLAAYNTIIAGNVADESGDDINFYSSSAVAYAYNTLSGCEEWTGGVNNLTYSVSSPLFTNAANGDYTLAENSQAINAGDKQYVAASTLFDLAGNHRISGETVDIGAYEYQFPVVEPVQLDAPTLSSSADSTSIIVSWNAVSDAVGYSVSYKLASAANWSNDVDAGTNLSYTIDGLEPNTEYSVRVRAIGDGVDYLDSEYATLSVTTGAANSLVVTSEADVVDDSDNLFTLREALAAAQPGETITFASSLKGKTISLDSSLGELTISQSAIIDASSIWNAATSAPGLTISGGGESRILKVSEDADVEVKGITLTNGYSSDESGGAIYVSSDASLSLVSCVVTNSYAEYYGGAAYVANGSVFTATNSLFAGNYAEYGGGFELLGNATLYNCTVTRNEASSYGGGVDLDEYGVLDAYNTIIAGNSASYDGDDVSLYGHDGGFPVANAYNTLSSFADWTEGANYVVYNESKPLFTNASNGDYTLAERSQAINRGNNQSVSTDVDLAGNSRIFDGTVDLGAYEYQSVVVPLQLDAPENLREIIKKETSITVAWDAVDLVSSYRVWYQPSGGAAVTVDVDSTTTSYTLTDLTPNTTYAVKVAAIGDEICYTDSDYSAPTSMTMPDNPEARSTIVTTAEDVYNVFDEVVSLREALDYAQSGETITFDGSLQGETIKLNSTLGQLVIDKSLTIDASALRNAATSEPGLTISGEGASRILYVDGDSDLALEINWIALKNGYSDDGGGAIYSEGAKTLSLNNCAICDNEAATVGGGIFFWNATTSFSSLVNCTLTNNTSGDDGGAICKYYGTLSLDNCVISDNNGVYGGGVYSYQGSTSLAYCDLTNNYASYSGGAIEFLYGTPTLANCTVINNTARYRGGGVFKNSATLSIENCVISDNKATYSSYGGGGVYSSNGAATLTNCTVTNNTAGSASKGYGGGVYLAGTSPVLNAYNTIIAGNAAATNGAEIYLNGSNSAANAYNTLSSFADWANASEEGVVNYSYDSTAPLFTNALNGDYTLAEGSQAIDKGDDQYVASTTTVDLAGNPRKSGDAVDLGAYEYQFVAEPVQLDAPAPTDTTKTATTFTASWDAVENASGYRLVWKNKTSSSYTYVTLGASATSYTLEGLDSNATYNWKVQALGDKVDYLNSAFCATQTVKMREPVQLAAPTPTGSVKSDATIVASWDAVENATGYRFVWKNNQTNTSYTYVSLGASATSYTLTELEEGATYYWKVQALGDKVDYLNSEFCKTQTVKPNEPVQLAAPTPTGSTKTETTITASWDAVANASGYQFVWKNNRTNTSYTYVTLGSSATSFTLSNLEEGATYYWKVRAVGDKVDYLTSSFCATQTVKPGAPVQLAAPTPTGSVRTATAITASWETVANASGYQFIWKNNRSNTSYTYVSVNASATSFTLSNLEEGATYYWKVRAVGDKVSSLTSDFCATQTVKPSQTVASAVLDLGDELFDEIEEEDYDLLAVNFVA